MNLKSHVVLVAFLSSLNSANTHLGKVEWYYHQEIVDYFLFS